MPPSSSWAIPKRAEGENLKHGEFKFGVYMTGSFSPHGKNLPGLDPLGKCWKNKTAKHKELSGGREGGSWLPPGTAGRSRLQLLGLWEDHDLRYPGTWSACNESPGKRRGEEGKAESWGAGRGLCKSRVALPLNSCYLAASKVGRLPTRRASCCWALCWSREGAEVCIELNSIKQERRGVRTSAFSPFMLLGFLESL